MAMVIQDKYFEVFIKEEKIIKRVKELSIQLSADYKSKSPLFVPVLNGAFLFASDLIKEVSVPCQVSFVKVASYKDMESTGIVKNIIGLNSDDVKGKDVILIDDIVDTGLTMSAVIQEITKMGPTSIEIVALLLKPEALQKHLELKYVGFEIPNNFVVGYGLDYAGYGRNLKDIYQIKK